MENAMLLPYVIDNQEHKLADVLNAVMESHPGMSLDVASAYFSVSGYRVLRERLASLRSFRLLLGFQPAEAKDTGLRPNVVALKSTLAWMDTVVDQAVYRLYGLTEEEVRVGEGKE